MPRRTARSPKDGTRLGSSRCLGGRLAPMLDVAPEPGALVPRSAGPGPPARGSACDDRRAPRHGRGDDRRWHRASPPPAPSSPGSRAPASRAPSRCARRIQSKIDRAASMARPTMRARAASASIAPRRRRSSGACSSQGRPLLPRRPIEPSRLGLLPLGVRGLEAGGAALVLLRERLRVGRELVAVGVAPVLKVVLLGFFFRGEAGGGARRRVKRAAGGLEPARRQLAAAVEDLGGGASVPLPRQSSLWAAL